MLGTLVALFSGGHVLIESVPGLGKTLFVRALGRVLGCQFGRIQFTADLMPSDITGSRSRPKNPGVPFPPRAGLHPVLLADEINRPPAKTHAAFLEIVQESRVTVEGTSHKLGTVVPGHGHTESDRIQGIDTLPEAQLDRFMFKLLVHYQ